jgi:hypothetical protein
LLFVEVSDPVTSSNALTLMADPTVNSDGCSADADDGAAGTSASSLAMCGRTWMRSRRSSVGKR